MEDMLVQVIPMSKKLLDFFKYFQQTPQYYTIQDVRHGEGSKADGDYQYLCGADA